MTTEADSRLLAWIRRLAPVGRRLRPPTLGEEQVITLRLSGRDGDLALEQLVELSGAPLPVGLALVAEVDGRPRAALPVEGGPLLIDPFHPSAELGSLLTLRLAQLEASRPGQSLRVP